jgi:hypothetical protein
MGTLGKLVGVVTVGAVVALGQLVVPASGTPAAATSPAARYNLVDLTNLTPAGFNTPVPVAIDTSGEVVGEVFSGAPPSASGAPELADLAMLNARTDASRRSVPHVFVYESGRFVVVPTPQDVTQAWVGGLDDSGDFTVVRCVGNDCNNYFVVHGSVDAHTASFSWTALQGGNAGVGGLGAIATNGDVSGAIASPQLTVGVVWKRGPDGSYSAPVTLGADPHAGHFSRAYDPLTISSGSGRDIEGGVEETPSFYPSGSPALWGPHFVHDFGYIGSETLAMTSNTATTNATVGCFEPVPVCSPGCPIDAQVMTVTDVQGTPKVTASLTLDNPSKSVPHCGVSPLGVTVDPAGRPFTVGLMAVDGTTQYLPEAVIWVAKKLEMLNGQVAAPPGTNLQWAVGVNSAGWIIGTGVIGGQAESAYLLMPTGRW